MHSSSRESFSDLGPQNRADLVSYETVKDSSSLLGIYESEIDGSWGFNTFDNRLFGDFMKDDSFYCCRVDIKHMAQMPSNGFSFAILIRCYPDSRVCFGKFFQTINRFEFFGGDFILWNKSSRDINSETLTREITNMPHRCNDFEVASEEFFNRFSFCRRLDNNKIFGHNFLIFFNNTLVPFFLPKSKDFLSIAPVLCQNQSILKKKD